MVGTIQFYMGWVMLPGTTRSSLRLSRIRSKGVVVMTVFSLIYG